AVIPRNAGPLAEAGQRPELSSQRWDGRDTISAACGDPQRESHGRETQMASDQVKRKLAAILAADIAGYSRLMGTDAAGTLTRLKEYRRELIDPKNKQYRGRVVKTTGDGI